MSGKEEALKALRRWCSQSQSRPRLCLNAQDLRGDGRLVVIAQAGDLAPLEAALSEAAAHGFSAAAVRPLSLRGLTALEIALRGSAFEDLQSALAPRRRDGLDLSLQPGRLGLCPPGLLVMDMDSTLVEQEGIDELAREVGVYEEVASVTEEAMRGRMDFDESLRRRVACLKDAPQGIFQRVRARIRLTAGSRRMLAVLRRHGTRLALLSGGFQQLGAELARDLHFDHFYANRLEVRRGRLTGRLTGPIVNASRKAELLGELAARHDLRTAQTAALGDGANDLPMLLTSGLGIAFCAKPKVRREALHCLDVRRLDAALYYMGFSDDEIYVNSQGF
ncbi:MAG TPA: phosphoserine phosphatase SerB [Acidobacteriota bacterium]|nr:phosphoserine phosphatase SerB [Acidobacteriota bacterium]